MTEPRRALVVDQVVLTGQQPERRGRDLRAPQGSLRADRAVAAIVILPTVGSFDTLHEIVAARSTALTRLICFASVGLTRPVQGADPAAAVAPEEAYDQTFVGFEDRVLVIYSAGHRPSRTWIPYRGKYHIPLAGADFYLAIDRPDLASAYRHRHAAELALIFGGLGATLGGLYFFERGLYPAGRHWLGPGAVLLTAGLGGILAGWILEPDPVDEPEAREAADLYNKGLKRRLGLTREAPSARGAHARTSWAPVVSTAGGGIQFTCAF